MIPLKHQWGCESTSTNFQEDLTVTLENPKIRVFPKNWRKVNHFKICIYKLVK